MIGRLKMWQAIFGGAAIGLLASFAIPGGTTIVQNVTGKTAVTEGAIGLMAGPERSEAPDTPEPTQAPRQPAVHRTATPTQEPIYIYPQSTPMQTHDDGMDSGSSHTSNTSTSNTSDGHDETPEPAMTDHCCGEGKP